MTKMPTSLLASVLSPHVYLHASENGAHEDWLHAAVGGLGRVNLVALDEQALNERIAETHPRAVFLDFSHGQALPSNRLAKALRRDWPDLLLIGIGFATDTNTTLCALRAGVDDFLDLDGNAGDVPPVLQALTLRRQGARAPQKGHTVALLGARTGLGVSTLACNLAALLQARRAAALAGGPGKAAPRQGTALLDMGLPARDGLLYLGLQSGFSFVDGVHNLRRIDPTLLQTALAQHASGAAVLPLPADLGQIREISHTDAVSLIQRMAECFDVQIADLGGLSNVDFVAKVAQSAEKVWVVCDQSIGAIVSTSALLRELRERNIATDAFSVVINRFEKSVALPAEDIAQQLGLPLSHVLPARAAALLNASSSGQLIADTARTDPYVQAVSAMAEHLMRWMDVGTAPSGGPGQWMHRVNQVLHKWKSRE